MARVIIERYFVYRHVIIDHFNQVGNESTTLKRSRVQSSRVSLDLNIISY